MKKALVAYFSASGVTAGVAKNIAKAINADIYEICPQTPYTDADLNWKDSNSRSSVEMRDKNCRPPLANKVPDLSAYEVVFVGFPVWWYREPSIIDTFMESCNFDGQTVVPFATSGGSGLGSSAQNMQALAPKAKVLEGKLLNSIEEESQQNWAKRHVQ